MTIKSPTLYRI